MEKDYKKAEYYENRELSWLGFDERIPEPILPEGVDLGHDASD